LLLISGGGGDAGNYSDLADSLADEYTVLTYDRRGNSRSRLRADPTKLRVEEQSADARAVLDHTALAPPQCSEAAWFCHRARSRGTFPAHR
jgi:pimeloyl-ACP methyl ester carboxylesterase